MHTAGPGELALLDGMIGNVGQVGQDGAHQHAQHLAQHRDGDGQRQGGFHRGVGQDCKGGADDGGHIHIGRCGRADVDDAQTHQLDGCADSQTHRQVAQQQADDGAGDEGPLEVQAAQQAAVQNAEHAYQTQDEGCNKHGSIPPLDSAL